MNIDQHRALMPAQFNLNDDVKVKLTDHGRDLLAKKRLTRQPDEAGYNRFQLWELMNIFGEHFYNGCSIPFEFNRILLAPFNPAMNDQHRADPRLWAAAKKWGANTMDMANCILELRDRVEALEGQYETQRQATLAWGKDVDNHSRWIDDHLKRIMALEAGQKTKPSPAVDRVRDLQDQIRDGSLTLAEALDLGVLPASDMQDAMRRAASKAAHEMGGIRKNYTYSAPAAPAPTDSYCDIWHRFQLEEGQKTPPSPAVDRVRDLRDQIRSGPECSLVERVARRLARFASEGLPGDDATPIASAVLCDVAAWILEQAPAPGPLVKWLGGVSTPFEVMADMLRSEANQ
jgi:hypothetical protein